MKRVWAVIGGGNGGQSVAGHLGYLGEKVRLFDVVPETAEALNRKSFIEMHNSIEGSGPIEFATSDIGKAMEGANIIMMVLPSIYHRSMAEKIIPHLKDGMTVLLHPEASCGAVAFRKAMKDLGCNADIVLGAAGTLLYSTRIEENGVVHIFGIKQDVPMAALPAADNKKLAEAVCPVLPNFHLVENVLVTSLGNINAMMHPAPMLLNTSRIEADPFVPYEYYHEGMTPGIGKFVEAEDTERIAVAAAFGIKLRSIREDYVIMYKCGDENTPLYQLCKNNPAYTGIMTHHTLHTRYCMEDIPYSLVAIQTVAAAAGVATPCIDAIVQIGRTILDDMDEGRTAAALGIEGMSREDLLRYVNGT